jgi:hypothetical protein
MFAEIILLKMRDFFTDFSSMKEVMVTLSLVCLGTNLRIFRDKNLIQSLWKKF